MPDEPESKKQLLFTRQSTGLVKSISAFDVLTFTVLAAGPIVLIPFGILQLPSIYQGSDITLILGISIILLLALAYNTVALSSALPRAGGDYVFGSRVVHPIWGMIPSFMILLSFVVGVGTLVVLTMIAFLGPAILTSYFPQYGTTVLNLFYLSQTNLFLISALALILIFGLAMTSTKAWFWFVRIVSLFALIMMLVFIGYLLTTSPGTIRANFDSQLSTGMNSTQFIDNATSMGWSANVRPNALTTAGAMIFVFFFLAAPISAYFSGEIKNTSKSMVKGMLGGTILSWVITAVGLLVWVAAFGYNFLSAYGFQTFINPTTAPSGAFSANALILAVVSDPNVAFLIGLGIALATLGLAAAPMLPASRILFAWSFDRIIPSSFASVNRTTHTPLISLGVFALLTIIVAGLDSFYMSTIGGFLATTILVAIAFLPNGVTAALLPYRRREVYRSSPSVVQKKIGGIPLLTITGLVHAIGFAVLIILVFLNPVAAGTNNGQVNSGALAVIVIGLLLSIIFYPIAKAIRKSSGINLDLIFKEIPPE